MDVDGAAAGTTIGQRRQRLAAAAQKCDALVVCTDHTDAAGVCADSLYAACYAVLLTDCLTSSPIMPISVANTNNENMNRLFITTVAAKVGSLLTTNPGARNITLHTGHIKSGGV